MAASSTTRRGNGSSGQWGGPKRDGVSNSALRIPGPGRPVGVKTGEGKKAKSAEQCAPLVGDAVAVWREIMMDPAQPAAARVAAAEKVIHRAEGATPQKIEVNGNVDWSRLTDEELAAIAASGGRDAAPEETTH